jgi:hypothetical protein
MFRHAWRSAVVIEAIVIEAIFARRAAHFSETAPVISP